MDPAVRAGVEEWVGSLQTVFKLRLNELQDPQFVLDTFKDTLRIYLEAHEPPPSTRDFEVQSNHRSRMIKNAHAVFAERSGPLLFRHAGAYIEGEILTGSSYTSADEVARELIERYVDRWLFEKDGGMTHTVGHT